MFKKFFSYKFIIPFFLLIAGIGLIKTNGTAIQNYSHKQPILATSLVEQLTAKKPINENTVIGKSDTSAIISTDNTSTSGQKVNILILKYFPLDKSGTKLDSSLTGNGDSADYVKNWVNSQTNMAITKLTEATRYHGYKNNSAVSALNYQIFESKEYMKAVPRKYWPNTGTWYSDYQKMLSEDVDICDYVDNRGIKDVWIWSYQHDSAPQNGIFESNMSMGRVSKNYWNRSGYGDISNDHYKLNNLPQCEKTYVVYNFNYHDYRGTTDMLHSYGHQVENEMAFADSDIWLNKFTTRNLYTYADKNTVKGCGDVHSPPNVNMSTSYNYQSLQPVKSDCEDWKPDRSGQSQNVTCRDWFQNGNCIDDGGFNYYLWWFQNIPGLNNNLSYQGKMLRNWWEFMGDFDAALAKGKSLLTNTASSTLTPTPTVITPTPSPSQVITVTPSPTVSPSPATPSPTLFVTPTPTPSNPEPNNNSPLPLQINLLKSCLTGPSKTDDEVVEISWTNPLPSFVDYVELRNSEDIKDWATSTSTFNTQSTSIKGPNGFMGYEGRRMVLLPGTSYKATLQYRYGVIKPNTITFTVPQCSPSPTINASYSTPTNLVGQCSAGKLNIIWSPVNEVDNYKINIRKYNHGITSDQEVETKTIAATSYIKDVATGQSYNWSVWSVDNNGSPHADAANGPPIVCN